MEYLNNFEKKLESIKENHKRICKKEEIFQTFDEIQKSKEYLKQLDSQKLDLLQKTKKHGDENEEIWEKCKREIVQM
jgi:hypothetical protein